MRWFFIFSGGYLGVLLGEIYVGRVFIIVFSVLLLKKVIEYLGFFEMGDLI